MSIALPTVEREWHLQPAQLQWMMSAYPLSSVSFLHSMTMKSLLKYLYSLFINLLLFSLAVMLIIWPSLIGMFVSGMWSARRRVRSQACFPRRSGFPSHLHARMWVRTRYVLNFCLSASLRLECEKTLTLLVYCSTDIIMLDILRGIQGVGAAATIPASVSALVHLFSF